uniref:Immunoglobulin like and fibronectin type III domain containing 1 n=1 Tax=Gallus gallus TaxID=9031 RepID=A0A8V0ZW38_CHICK
MTTRPGVKPLQKSSLRGVHITQFVDKIPKGCSTPDFERKPVSLTLQEGKNAIFRAAVKGVPAPEVKWKRAKGEMNDPAKYLMFYSPATSEHILQINKITAGDSDLYRCFAVNEYGEASCSAGLRIIQVGFKRKANYVTGHPAEDLKKNLQDLKKTLKKRAPPPKQKVVDKEAIFQLLLHADRKDYERICIKYGISDFRGMLRALQELRRDAESEQAKLIHSVRNMEHIKVNKDGSASFSLEMDLKSASSNIYLLKDGEKVRYGTGDEYRKYYLRQIGKKYYFIVNDVHPEDAGLYQVRVEDVPVFSTELDAESIPVRFQKPLRDLRCHEEEDVVFECVLRTPCYDAVWLHKAHPLEASEKHQISVSPDGMTHQLIIKNAVTSDNGLYTLDTGLCSSRAWLLVEHAKEAKIQDEEEHEKSDWQKGTPDKDRAKKLKRGEYLGDEDHPMDAGMKRDGWYRSDQEGSQGYSADADGEFKFLGKEGLRKTNRDESMGPGQFSRELGGADSMMDGASNIGLKILEDESGLRPVHSQGSMTGRADTDDGLGGGTKSYSVDGRHDSMLGAVDVDMGGAEGVSSWHDKNAKLGDASSRAAFVGMKSLDGSSVSDGINLDSTRVGGAQSVYSKDGLPAAVDVNGVSINREGEIGSPYSKDNLIVDAGGRVGQAGISGLLYGPGGLPAGDGARTGAGGSFVGEMEVLYSPDGLPIGAGVDATAVKRGDLYGKRGQLSEPYGKDGLPAGMEAGVGGAGLEGAGSIYGKTSVGGAGVAGAGPLGSPYGKDGLPLGAGVGGAGVAGAGAVGSPYGKDGLPAGAGVGAAGVAGAGALGSPYGKDGVLAGAGVGGAGLAGAGAVGSPYGKDGVLAGASVAGAGLAGAGGVGSPYGKDGLPAGAGVGAAGLAGAGAAGLAGAGAAGLAGAGAAGLAGVGAAGLAGVGAAGLAGVGAAGLAGVGAVGSPFGKEGLPAGAGVGGVGVAGAGGLGSPYGKDGLPAGAGVGAAGLAGAGAVGSPYGKDGVLAGADGGGAGVAGAGAVGSPYGKDGVPSGAGVAGAGVAGAGAVGSPYGKDGLPAGAGVGAAGLAGAGAVGSPYGKDGLPAGAGVGGAGLAGAGAVGSPYGKDGLPAGAGVGAAGLAGAGAVGSPYGKDGLPAGAGVGAAGLAGAGAVGSPYGKDGLPAGAGVAGVGAGLAGAGGVGSPFGKDGLPAGAGVGGAGLAGAGAVGSPYGKDGLPAGAGVGGAGLAGARAVGSPYGKDGLPAGAGVGAAGLAGAGAVGSPYGKDGLPAGAGVAGVGAGLAGAGGVGSPFGKDGLPAGAGVGGAGLAGAGAVGSPYGKDGLPAGAGVGGAGLAGARAVGSPYGKDGLPAGAGVGGAGVAGAGALGSPFGKDGLPLGAGVGAAGLAGVAGAGLAGAGAVGSPYGKDGLPAGAGVGGAGLAGVGGAGLAGVGAAGLAGAGGVGSPYGKDGLPAGAGVGGAGLAGAGAVGSPYGKDGLPAGAGVGGAGLAGAGAVGSPYGKDGLPAGAVSGAAHFSLGSKEVMGSVHGQDALLGRAQGYVGGVGGTGLSSEGGGVGGSAIQVAGSAYGSAGSRAGESGASRLGGDGSELHSVHGKEGVVGAVGMGGEYGLDSRAGKSAFGEAGKGTASDFRGSEHKGSSHDKESLSGQGDARAEDRDLGQSGSRYGKDSASGGAGGRSHDRLFGEWKPGLFDQSSQGSDQMSAPYGGPSISQRKQVPSLDIKASDFLKSTESTEKRRRHHLDDQTAPRSRVSKHLNDVRVLKGEPTELSCAVNRHDLTGTWFKDGLKLTSMDGVSLEKEGLVHKLVISKVEDIHAGKYRFEAGDIKTEASIFVEDPPQVDEILLKNLTSVPTVAKAGEKVVIKIPFEGRLPVRATWLKDKIELGDDSRVRVDKTDTFTMLSISNAERKDCGDYKVRLKNDSGILDIDLKVEVIDKPQPPAGPMKIVESSANDVTIQWNPPKDDGGKPVQNYIIEKQQVGKSDWVAVGETPRSCTTFTTSKVEQDMSYYFRVRAVNAEGTSDALESDEVVTISKGSPGAPDPPEIIGVSKDTITISWKTPRRAGSSRISGYIVQKRKMGSMTWVPVNSVPVADKKLKITNLKKGLQYEFCVAAVNASGIGDMSAPSQSVFARDSTTPPGKVRDLKMTINDNTSVTLTWNAPEAKEGSAVEGYNVEMRSSNNLSWTKCNIFPIETTTYKVKGLQTKGTYFLRVRAINDCGPGEATELEACTEAVPRVVSPRFIIDKRVKNFLVIKAGNTIRVDIPYEAPPDSVLTWLKDGVPLPSRAKISTQDDTSQLLIKAAQFTDSGIYTVELTSGTGKRETFSFQVQVTDIPQPPGPIELRENVPNIVTVTWEPSTSEKWESNLFYTVLKRESRKGLWHVIGDLIYTNKFTYTKVIPGRDYYFRVVAKNHLGSSCPSDTVQPWRIRKPKADIQVRPQRYKGVNQNQPPRFLVPLKPHVVTTGSECRMSCAVGGHPPPKVTWYKDGKDLSNNPSYFGTNDFGVCSLVILGVSKADEGDYTVEATNESGRAFSRASLTIKDSCL